MNTSRGFTLLEILIALAIFTLIGLASNAVLTSVLNSDRLSTQRFDQLQTLQRAMMTIERDVLQALPRHIRIEGEASDTTLSGGQGEFESEFYGIGFVRGGWHNPQLVLPRSTLQPVVYRVQEGTLQRVYSNYVDNVVGAEPRIKNILDGVEGFSIEFVADAESDSEAYAGNDLPKAIRIMLNLTAFGDIQRTFLLTPVNQ
ncbi:type II secretion system minor pseudopilin GspJ [Alteromonadaceae bacterium BrNp21-10]|nr:type II secretion system minor pseudopilin GspJ [Alteromonadaceae bacterium BrNp21-10]